jgi:cytochrome c oxidase subunit II
LSDAWPSVLAPASPDAAHAASVSWVLIVGASVVLVIVMAVLAWALWRRRRTAARRVAWLLGAGVAFPGVVLLVLSAWVHWSGVRLDQAHDAQAVVVSVTAHSWWWEVRYREPVSGREIRLANEIHLPAGRPVTLALSSSDVIHSFWVPALGGKVDMLPGRVLHLRLGAAEPGRYRGQCAEFCGEQHARMALHVVVSEEAAFARWLSAQAQPARAPVDERQRQGLRVFNEQRCAACHHLRGLGAESQLGPDLTHVGSRIALGAGTLPNSEQSLRGWVADVQRHKPGARMPSAQIDADSLAALAHFLTQLK